MIHHSPDMIKIRRSHVQRRDCGRENSIILTHPHNTIRIAFTKKPANKSENFFLCAGSSRNNEGLFFGGELLEQRILTSKKKLGQSGLMHDYRRNIKNIERERENVNEKN